MRFNAEQFGDRLKERIDDLKISKSYLSDITGISYNSIRSYILGIRSPTAYNIVLLCEALNVYSDWLLGLEN